MRLSIQIFKVVSWARIHKLQEEWIGVDSTRFALIADEAHYAQNPKSVRTKGFLAMAARAVALYMLTGTPLKNAKPVNLFPLLKAARLPVARVKQDYETRFCAGHMQTLFVKRGGKPQKISCMAGCAPA